MVRTLLLRTEDAANPFANKGSSYFSTSLHSVNIYENTPVLALAKVRGILGLGLVYC